MLFFSPFPPTPCPTSASSSLVGRRGRFRNVRKFVGWDNDCSHRLENDSKIFSGETEMARCYGIRPQLDNIQHFVQRDGVDGLAIDFTQSVHKRVLCSDRRVGWRKDGLEPVAVDVNRVVSRVPPPSLYFVTGLK